MLRYRGPKREVLEKVKDLDVFDKVDEKYVEPTAVGGTLSIISFLLIVWLTYSELRYYMDANLVFLFSPDTDLDAKLKINIDLTIAMPCGMIGADILDSTSQNMYAFGELKEEDTWFELDQDQRKYFDAMKHINTYLREEYHTVSKFLWKSQEAAIQGSMPERKRKSKQPFDACRIHGSLILNKVRGIFHIIVGKSLHLAGSHIHLSMLYGGSESNFSHRINKLSFGHPVPGIIHPLEGYEIIAEDSTMLYQYFIEVVSTEVDTTLSKIKTYQYSAKEHVRPIDHDKGSHGTPGVFFKYDVSALKLKVSQERDNLVQFVIRLFSIISGIYVITSYLNVLLQTMKVYLLRKFVPELYDLPSKQPLNKTNSNPSIPVLHSNKSNSLLDNANAPFVSLFNKKS